MTPTVTDAGRIRVLPYTWDRLTKPRHGVAIFTGDTFRVFIPMTDITRISDRLIDILEAHERKNT
jgi:hypothetical protein